MIVCLLLQRNDRWLYSIIFNNMDHHDKELDAYLKDSEKKLKKKKEMACSKTGKISFSNY